MNLKEIKNYLNNKYKESLKEFNNDEDYNDLTKDLNLRDDLTNEIDLSDYRSDINITKDTRFILNISFLIFCSPIIYINHLEEMDMLLTLYDKVKIDSSRLLNIYINKYLFKILREIRSDLKAINLNKVVIRGNLKYPFSNSSKSYHIAYDVNNDTLHESNLDLQDIKRIFYDEFPLLLVKHNKNALYKKLTEPLNLTFKNNNQPYSMDNDIDLRVNGYTIDIRKVKFNKVQIDFKFRNQPRKLLLALDSIDYNNSNNEIVNKYKNIYKKNLVDCSKVADNFLHDTFLPYLKSFNKYFLFNGINKINVVSHYSYPLYGEGDAQVMDLKLT